MTDSHQVALGQLELDRASGKITQAEYEATKAKLDEAHRVATKPLRIAMLVIVGLPLLFIAGCFAVISAGGSDSDGDGDYSSAVIARCRASVRDQLKAPSTAKFSGESATAVSTSGKTKTYRVTGSVDAENSFGAPIRTRYTCQGSATSGSFSDATATADLAE